MCNRIPLSSALLGGACSLMMVLAQANAQQSQPGQPAQQTRQKQTTASETLRLPPEQPIVVLSIQSPSEVRVGRSFNYQIRVENSSSNIAVHNLVIAQHASKGFEIESSRLDDQPNASRTLQGNPRPNRADKAQSQKNKGKQDESTNKSSSDSDSDDTQASDTQDKQSDQPATQKDQSQQDQSQGDDSQGDAAQRSDSDGDQPKSDQANEDASDSNHKQGDQSATSSDSGQADRSRWTIDRLMPGQSRTINVTAVSDADGAGNVCVAVESYVPAICLATRFTKPELEIVKQAPEQANICDEIRFEYLVKNTGTGDLQRFTVRDELPEGLQTIDGNSKLEFTLDDGLKAGGVRKFEARLRASKTGEFTSRAMVESPDGVEAKSNRAGTTVRKAELALAIEGPQAQEVGGLANYTVRITNRGDAPAPGTQLKIYFPRSADLVRASQPHRSSQAVAQSSSQRSTSDTGQAAHDHAAPADDDAQRAAEDKGSPENNADGEDTSSAKEDDQSAQDQGQQPEKDQPKSDQSAKADEAAAADDTSDQQAEQKQSDADTPLDKRRRKQNRENQQRSQMAQNDWQLGTLGPGETVELTYVLRPYEGGDLNQIAVAEYTCATVQDREILRAESKTSTEILMLAGLRLTVIDDHDPVPSGQNVVYTISVLNQGNAPAHNIEVHAKLPKELKFVETRGQTKSANSDNEVTFEPVETLEPGKRASWQLIASVNEGVGEKTQDSIEVQLDSDDLEETITSEEPTTFFNAEKRTAQRSDEDASADKK